MDSIPARPRNSISFFQRFIRLSRFDNLTRHSNLVWVTTLKRADTGVLIVALVLCCLPFGLPLFRSLGEPWPALICGLCKLLL